MTLNFSSAYDKRWLESFSRTLVSLNDIKNKVFTLKTITNFIRDARSYYWTLVLWRCRFKISIRVEEVYKMRENWENSIRKFSKVEKKKLKFFKMLKLWILLALILVIIAYFQVVDGEKFTQKFKFFLIKFHFINTAGCVDSVCGRTCRARGALGGYCAGPNYCHCTWFWF